jgi:RNA polymerase sigma-70 factor (ECF subfamily)
MIDEVFIQGLKKGVPSFQEKFYKDNHRNVFSQTYRILRSYEDAEDATQITFLKAYAKISGYKGDSALSSWLYTIARNEALMMLRSKKAIERLQAMAADELKKDRLGQTSLYKLDPILRRSLQKSFDALPKNYKPAFYFWLAGQSNPDTSAVLGHHIGKVKTDIQRGRRRMIQDFKKAANE